MLGLGLGLGLGLAAPSNPGPTPASSLQHIRHGEVDVLLELAVVELGALDHDQVRREVDSPCEGGGAHEHLVGVAEELVHTSTRMLWSQKRYRGDMGEI